MILIFLSINAVVMSGAITAGFITGYIMRTVRLRSLKRRVYELESEMLRNHAEILNLQKSVAAPPSKPSVATRNTIVTSVVLALDNIPESRQPLTGKTGS